MPTPATIGVDQSMDFPTDQQMITAYLESLRLLSRADDTIKLRRKVLTRVSRDLPYGLGETNVEELRAWLYRKEWGPGTWATYLVCLRDFYGWATNPRDAWLRGDNPALELDDVPKPEGYARPCSDDQLERILTESAEPYNTWAHLAAYQGLRCIEISRLDREHVTERVFNVVKGKGGRPRVHDTHPAVWDLIRPLQPGPVARLVRHGDRASADYISGRTAKYFTAMGLDGVTLHRLRHWLGVTTQRLYRDIRVTQAVLGHKSLQSTQIYTMASMEQQKEARSMLPRFGG